MTRLTRRDRAALALAYECLRMDAPCCPSWHRPFRAHELVLDALTVLRISGVSLALRAACSEERLRCDEGALTRGMRLLRARLALLIRALLRADAHEGEARSFYVAIGTASTVYTTHGDAVETATQLTARGWEDVRVVRMSPLWEQCWAGRAR